MNAPVGIIFIDCWQNIVDQSNWPAQPKGFDFYESMINILDQYQAKNLVFHTGDFGDLPLAQKLQSWHQQGNAVDIMDLQYFERHYRARDLYNWIVVGGHWQRCTHHKPLGFYTLLNFKKLDPRLRIFSHSDCTVKFLNNDIDTPELDICNSTDYELDSLTWESDGKLYELTGPLTP
jgi:hypothetical protein